MRGAEHEGVGDLECLEGLQVGDGRVLVGELLIGRTTLAVTIRGRHCSTEVVNELTLMTAPVLKPARGRPAGYEREVRDRGSRTAARDGR